jgi:hypothetical protein
VEDAFSYVLVGVVAIGGLAAFIAFLGSGKAYDELGKGGLSLRDGTDGAPDEGGPRSLLGRPDAVRDTEIRQMLEARNARRARRGEALLDVEQELAALTRPAADAGIEAEVRHLVRARNSRRIRRGQEPLDVEAEVARQLRELT